MIRGSGWPSSALRAPLGANEAVAERETSTARGEAGSIERNQVQSLGQAGCRTRAGRRAGVILLIRDTADSSTSVFSSDLLPH